MPASAHPGEVLVQIPPARSPLLLPTNHHRNSADSLSLGSIPEDRDVFDNLEFLAPGDWEERQDDGNAESEDDEDIEDFSLEDGHVAGVPSANVGLEAKQYHTPDFAATLLELLRDALQIPGWNTLPLDVPSSLIYIHKVSGSLTNAVFFVSIPATVFELTTEETGRKALTPAAVLKPTEELRSSTPTPDTPISKKEEDEAASSLIKITIEAPTLLLRIYGPSSGSLISRKTELHILHTLSSTYAIGPRVLGTFSNGRVEEYFHSRALHKQEMRDARISRWIGRRMRELHRVDLERMEVPGGDAKNSTTTHSRSGPERPILDVGGRQGSGASMYSTSSGSSIFSFGASTCSASSTGSSSSLHTIGSEFGTPIVASPLLLPRRMSSESRAEAKKRSRSLANLQGRRTKDKLGVWENITRWTREAKLVLKELDDLASVPGFCEFLASCPQSDKEEDNFSEAIPSTLVDLVHTAPLSSPNLTFSVRASLNLPLFEQQVKLYRSFVRDWEKREGKSKRVFSHNDTQYGNLLLLTPKQESEGRTLERPVVQAPHQNIIVVDLEYASANPRGFDIANHFIEWQADYHHETLSHSLFAHMPYPQRSERQRFLKAYVGCDGGYDGEDDVQSTNEDPRVLRLEEEVKVWEPSSHAMWAVWGIVQAKEDLLNKVAKWKKACEKQQQPDDKEGLAQSMKDIKLDVDNAKGRPTLIRGKSGEFAADSVEGSELTQDSAEEVEPEADFDYLSYALGRMKLFRDELKILKIVD